MRSKKSEELKRLIYFSKPTAFDYKTIQDILTISRENNIRTGVTGSLIYRSDLFFQFLEGPPDAVMNTYEKIKLDTRHSEIQKILEDITNRRFFASWAMKEDATHTWMWTRQEVKDGVLSRITQNEVLETFKRLSRGVDQFVHTGEVR
ncbi:MAG: BLUF domain-containing protein [Pseudomonadota bacterium]|nr:BLUF domain-containing protein [Pseudomonadota bacterium]